MDEQQKYIANRAIDENVVDTTARQIIRYVMACELWGQDTISPSNEYLAKKYGWSEETARVAIGKAKKSQFITTTGYGKKRCLELNVGFLKSKMAEAYQKSLKPKADFSDVLPTTSPNTLPTGLPTTLPTGFGAENAESTPQNQEKGGYSNSNRNNNNSSVALAPREVIDSDSEESTRAKSDPVIPSPYTPQAARQFWRKHAERRLRVLAWFLSEKDLWDKATSKPKLQAIMRRHNNAAVRIANAGWLSADIEEARDKMLENKNMEDEWTLETLEKYLTK